MRETEEILTRASRERITPEEAGLTAEQHEQWNLDWAQLQRPPLDVPAAFGPARDALLWIGLLSPVTSTDQADRDARYLVHRWTALALATRTDPGRLTEAHRRAGRYWRWRVEVWPQEQADDIQQLLLARRHHHEAGDLVTPSASVTPCATSCTPGGRWHWEQDLCVETLGWLPDRTIRPRGFLHQLGLIAAAARRLRVGRQRYHAALTIDEEIGDRAGTAIGYHQLGIVAQLRGDYQEAERASRRSLTIEEELGDRAGIGAADHQLGMIAELRGDYQQAEQLLPCLPRHRRGARRPRRHRHHVPPTRHDRASARGLPAGRAALPRRLGHPRGDRRPRRHRHRPPPTRHARPDPRGTTGRPSSAIDAALAIREEIGDRPASPATTTNSAHSLTCAGTTSRPSSATTPRWPSPRRSATAPASPGAITSSAPSPARTARTTSRPSSAPAPHSPSWRRSATAPASPPATSNSACSPRSRGLPEGRAALQRRAQHHRGDRRPDGHRRQTSRLGGLQTVRGEAAEAVPYQRDRVVRRKEIGSPDVQADLYWLARRAPDAR